jgi:uncharacterized LabA/DUF88 family protein
LIREAEAITGLPVLRVHWYDSAKDGVPDRSQERIGELPKVKLRLGRFGYDGQQKGVDLRLGLDLVNHAQHNAAEVFLLVSGDDDITEAVEEAQAHGVSVVVLAVPSSRGVPHGVSRHLVRAADELVTLSADVIDDAVIPIETPEQPADDTGEGIVIIEPGADSELAQVLADDALEPESSMQPDVISETDLVQEVVDVSPIPLSIEPVAPITDQITQVFVPGPGHGAAIPVPLPAPVTPRPTPKPSVVAEALARMLPPTPKDVSGKIGKPGDRPMRPTYSTGPSSPIAGTWAYQWDETIRNVVDRVLMSLSKTTTLDAWNTISLGRPSIPQAIDKALLLDATEAMGVYTLSDTERFEVRAAFWREFDSIDRTGGSAS